MKKSTFIIGGGIIFLSEVIWCLYKSYKKYLKTTTDRIGCYTHLNNSQPINEVMFFSRESADCRLHINRKKPCSKINCSVGYLRKLVNIMNSAKISLDVCMYFFTCKEFADAMVFAHKRGVIVRIIIDRHMAYNHGSQTIRLHESGVALRMQHLDVLMHHKFAVVDGNILIAGSMNWTMSAFFGNYEHIIITNQSSLVLPYITEFQKLWSVFENPICPDINADEGYLK